MQQFFAEADRLERGFPPSGDPYGESSLLIDTLPSPMETNHDRVGLSGLADFLRVLGSRTWPKSRP